MTVIFLGACKLQAMHSEKTAKIFRTTNLSVHLKGEQPELYTQFKRVEAKIFPRKCVMELYENLKEEVSKL